MSLWPTARPPEAQTNACAVPSNLLGGHVLGCIPGRHVCASGGLQGRPRGRVQHDEDPQHRSLHVSSPPHPRSGVIGRSSKPRPKSALEHSSLEPVQSLLVCHCTSCACCFTGFTSPARVGPPCPWPWPFMSQRSFEGSLTTVIPGIGRAASRSTVSLQNDVPSRCYAELSLASQRWFQINVDSL